MSKIKLTKGELKRQRDSLAQFEHFLPILVLKKQQLQIRLFEIRRRLGDLEEKRSRQEEWIRGWAGLLADPEILPQKDFASLVLPQEIRVETANIAGANVPVFREAVFKDPVFDYFWNPYWMDAGIQKLRDFFSLAVEAEIVKKQISILGEELRVTTQRVNLFEKVKIPQCLENIRRIRIYIGDQMANAVGISKTAKRKIEMAGV